MELVFALEVSFMNPIKGDTTAADLELAICVFISKGLRYFCSGKEIFFGWFMNGK